MKKATLYCIRCTRGRVFYGKDAQTIAAQIDKSGWVSRPTEKGDLCNDCANKAQRGVK